MKVILFVVWERGYLEKNGLSCEISSPHLKGKILGMNSLKMGRS
jgi:hypothetical protein